MTTTLINTVVLLMMAATAIGIVRSRNLFAVVILGSLYSFLMATIFLVLDAVDVSMTEAAVGAGISTVLLLSTLYLTRSEESKELWACRNSALPTALFISTSRRDISIRVR
jgi:multicomponent Na+:H+ antiporter subunit B